MCTEVGQKKKKCSGGGAGQSGVHDYGFYGSTVVLPPAWRDPEVDSPSPYSLPTPRSKISKSGIRAKREIVKGLRYALSDKEIGNYQAYQSPSNKQGRSAMKNSANLDVRDEKMEGGIVGATGSMNTSSANVSKITLSKSKMTQRLIHRNLPFCQSKNFVNVTNQYGKHRDAIYKLFRLDWFHVFLRLNTMLSVTILLLIWTVQILIFASLYVAVDGQNPRSVTQIFTATGHDI
jgi:hypothetical protein